MNETASALEQAELAVDRATRCDDGFYIVRRSIYIARTFFSRGDMARAREAIEAVEHLAERRTVPLTEVLAASAWKARIWLAEGQMAAAGHWAEEQRFDPDEEPSRLHEIEYFVHARILIAQERGDEAVQLLEWAQTLANSDRRVTTMIESLSLQALAHHAAGNLDYAPEFLDRALSLAEPITNESAGSSQPELIERLSERELDVLQLMAEGMSNEQIGEKLFISIHTVKVHTRNIYAKLDTHNRTEAVARARYLGILTDSPQSTA